MSSEDVADLSRLVRRQRVMIAVAVAAAALSLVGLGASVFITSPAQQAAAQGPPAASVLTAQVERIVLRGTSSVRGSVVPRATLSVPVVTPVGSDLPVVTRAPRSSGDRLRPGNLLMEVSGRPVLVLSGAVPMYRDLVEGTTGPDVIQLQKALRALGYSDGDRSGAFGPGTRRAVRRLYADRGYQVATAEALPPSGAATVPSAPSSAGTVPSAPSSADGVAPLRALTKSSSSAGPVVRVPRGELVFVSSFPATVGTLTAARGTTLAQGDTLATILTGGLVVRGTAPPGDQKGIAAGQKVTVLDEQAGRQTSGRVASIGGYVAGGVGAPGASGSPGGSGAAPLPDAAVPPSETMASGYPVVVTPDRVLDAGWAGADVVLIIVTSSTSGPVLAVPVAAITQASDGTTSVTVRSPNGAQRRIPVTTGQTTAGRVQVSPVGGGRLTAGDAVVIGS